LRSQTGPGDGGPENGAAFFGDVCAGRGLSGPGARGVAAVCTSGGCGAAAALDADALTTGSGSLGATDGAAVVAATGAETESVGAVFPAAGLDQLRRKARVRMKDERVAIAATTMSPALRRGGGAKVAEWLSRGDGAGVGAARRGAFVESTPPAGMDAGLGLEGELGTLN
jgi:hypothetical protein